VSWWIECICCYFGIGHKQPHGFSKVNNELCGKLRVCASTYVPTSSRKQTPILVRFNSEEKAASILHLKWLCYSFCHTHTFPCANCSCWSTRKPSAVEEWFEDAFADTQPSIRFWALEITWTAVSFSLGHSLLLRCFYKLHKTAANLCCNSFCSVWRREKIVASAQMLCWIVVMTVYHKPATCLVWTAKGHWKKTWTKSSTITLQLTQLTGHWTPLACNRALVRKNPLHMRQRKFLIFGGAFNFHMTFQLPGRCKCETSINSWTHSLYALFTE